ncbi:DUF2783 domain-containing protein [Roseibium suaedae]|uniref:DUF2783 domain-containing protein n=1 Tax=Roseibium suaedae TaxID=735517 RepID=A0A1M7BM67_9HYPH|nr:DUF2783 domain-containing protein [Roseibium suaedae]SHL56013.1 Protein of unknown function [Roseibium suaedae]
MTTQHQLQGFARPDDFYADLLAAHEGLTKSESDALNARLILLLAAQIGDGEALKDCLKRAKAVG